MKHSQYRSAARGSSCRNHLEQTTARPCPEGPKVLGGFSFTEANGHGSGLRREILRVVPDERLALGFEPHVRFDGLIDTVSDTVAAELLPTLVQIEVMCDNSMILRVLDDGRGIPATTAGENGIRNLNARASTLGDWCRVVARPDGGTMLE